MTDDSWASFSFLLFSKTTRPIISLRCCAACAGSTTVDAAIDTNNIDTTTNASATRSFNLHTADAIGFLPHLLVPNPGPYRLFRPRIRITLRTSFYKVSPRAQLDPSTR